MRAPLRLAPGEVRAILSIKLSSIGDVADVTPALRALRKSFPNAFVTHVVEKTCAPLLSASPHVHELVVFDRERALSLLPWRPFAALSAFVGEIRRTLRKVREVRYDLAIDFQGLARSVVFLYAARASAKIGRFGWRFLTARLPRNRNPVPAVSEYLSMVEMAGGRADGDGIEIVPSPEDAGAAEALIRRHGLSDPKAPAFLVVPFTRWKTKDWGVDRFALLCREISKRGLRLVLVGSAADRPRIAVLAEGIDGAVNLAGELPLAGLVPLARACRFTVTCDTGPMHVVAAAGKPIVAIYGPTDPVRTAPPGTRIVSAGMSCEKCYRRRCRVTPSCMERVAVERVLSACDDLLPRSR